MIGRSKKMKVFQGTFSELIKKLNQNLSFEEASAGGRAQLRVVCSPKAKQINEVIEIWESDPIFNYENHLDYEIIEYAMREQPYDSLQNKHRLSYHYQWGFVPTWTWKKTSLDKNGREIWKRSEKMIPLKVIHDDFY